MILSTAVFLITLGFGAWILGTIWEFQGIAAIGAILVVGVGAGAMIDGIDTQTGEIETQTDANTTAIEYDYESIGTTQSFPVGLLVTLLGGAMTGRTLNGGQPA